MKTERLIDILHIMREGAWDVIDQLSLSYDIEENLNSEEEKENVDIYEKLNSRHVIYMLNLFEEIEDILAKKRVARMKTYAKYREYEKGESFSCLLSPYDDDEIMVDCSESLYECWQPDSIEDQEYNLILIIGGIPVRARGNDFYFINEENLT